MIYGYCRISKPTQSIERQVRNIKSACSSVRIIEEAYTGATLNRPKWDKLLRTLRLGDVIIFDSVSRMSRNAAEGFAVYRDLFDRGIELRFLQEPHINTGVFRENLEKQIGAFALTGSEATDELLNSIRDALNVYMMRIAEQQIRLAFYQAEKELNDIRQRTREGIETARRNGKQIGAVEGKKLTTRKSISAKEIIKKHNRDFGGTLSDVETIKLCGVTRNTFYKYKRELSE